MNQEIRVGPQSDRHSMSSMSSVVQMDALPDKWLNRQNEFACLPSDCSCNSGSKPDTVFAVEIHIHVVCCTNHLWSSMPVSLTQAIVQNLHAEPLKHIYQLQIK
jgi:hypothetical protein